MIIFPWYGPIKDHKEGYSKQHSFCSRLHYFASLELSLPEAAPLSCCRPARLLIHAYRKKIPFLSLLCKELQPLWEPSQAFLILVPLPWGVSAETVSKSKWGHFGVSQWLGVLLAFGAWGPAQPLLSVALAWRILVPSGSECSSFSSTSSSLGSQGRHCTGLARPWSSVAFAVFASHLM